MATAAEVLSYFKSAEVEQAKLVLELAGAELESRASLSSARSQAAKKRWRGVKASNPAPVRRKRQSFVSAPEAETQAEVI